MIAPTQERIFGGEKVPADLPSRRAGNDAAGPPGVPADRWGAAGLVAANHMLPRRDMRAAPAGDSRTLLVGTNLPNTRTQNPGRTIEVTGMMIDRAKARRAGVRRGWLPSAGPAAQKLAALTDQAEAEVEPRKRIALLQEFDRRLGHVGPFAPLFQPAVPYAYWSNVQEVACHSVWAIDFYPIRKTV